MQEKVMTLQRAMTFKKGCQFF